MHVSLIYIGSLSFLALYSVCAFPNQTGDVAELKFSYDGKCVDEEEGEEAEESNTVID